MEISKKLKLLILEDSPADLELIIRELKKGNFNFDYKKVEHQDAFKQELSKNEPDLILSDYSMPEFTGLEALMITKFLKPHIPFIIVTGSLNEETAAECIKAGASDYVIKEHMVRLNSAIKSSLETKKAKEDKLKSEIALIESENKFRSLVESSSDHIFIFDLEGNYIFSNSNIAQFEKQGISSIIGLNIKELYAEDFAKVYLEKLHEVIKQKKEIIFEHEMSQSDDLHFHMYTLYPLVRNNGIWAVGGLCRDISDNKRALKLLEQSEEKYHRFFEEDLTGNIIATPDGKILDCNPAFLKMFRFPSTKAALKSNLYDYYYTSQEIEDFLKLLIDRKKLDYHTLKLRRYDDTPIHIIENVIGKFDSNDNLVEITAYIFDNTPLKLLEKQLLQAQKMESLGQLSSGIAHDFNNVLGGIIGYTDILLSKIETHHPFYDMISRIHQLSERANRITRQLLAFSRKQILELRIININILITDLLKLLGKTLGEHIEINFIPGQNLKNMKGDPAQIEQVIMNLCINARDAMPDRGKLTIVTENAYLDDKFCISYPALQPGFYNKISISDTGCGIDEENIVKIFEPFFTTKEIGKGTGLGLSMVHGIIGQHQGCIGVTSNIGKGTTFYFYLPTVEEELESSVQIEKMNLQKGSETVLLVEDDSDMRNMIETLLKDFGYDVICANNGEEGLLKFHENIDNISLIISDVQMPKMNGKELYDRMYKEKGDIKFLFVSGYADLNILENLLSKPGVMFLSKPFKIGDFSKRIRELLQ